MAEQLEAHLKKLQMATSTGYSLKILLLLSFGSNDGVLFGNKLESSLEGVSLGTVLGNSLGAIPALGPNESMEVPMGVDEASKIGNSLEAAASAGIVDGNEVGISVGEFVGKEVGIVV